MPPNNDSASGGRIFTFYSFKGGVGRTMALANTAFLAALNGFRVLVMDWDLEAPGLFYYFRGMQEGSGARAIRTAPGVLDLVWDWSSAIRAATSVRDVEQLSERFAKGTPFEAAVRPLIAEFEFEFGARGGALDLLGAGNAMISTPKPTPYEEALARFDWTVFFAEEAGGSMLTSLREWSKGRYDYIFIDSRTGFADVAGICTMQMPDAVALCFIYNRQNIDGISQVAGAIRDKRGSDIELHPAPMRVARENTPEEADARAHARKELIRKGGFTADEVDRGAKFLSIRLASNVPFYETVALITSDRPRTDPLVLNYLSFSSELLGGNLEIPPLEERWVQSVLRRLQQRQATTDYVVKLRSSDPARARDEVIELLDSALEASNFTESDEDYLRALVDVAVHVARTSEDPYDSLRIFSSASDLLRDLARDRKTWRALLIDLLEVYVETTANVLDPDEELVLLEEADSLLGAQPGPEAQLRRIANRRRAARTQLTRGDPDAAKLIVDDLSKLLSEAAETRRPSDRTPEILAARIDTHLLRGDIAREREEFEQARKQYEDALKLLFNSPDFTSRQEFIRLKFDAHFRLAHLIAPVISPTQTARHAVEALRWKGTSMSFMLYFVNLGSIVNAANDPRMAAEFVTLGLPDDERAKPQLTSFFGRSASRVISFTEYAAATLILLSREQITFYKEATELFVTTIGVVQYFKTRTRATKLRGERDTQPSIRRLQEAVRQAAALLPEESEAKVAALVAPSHRGGSTAKDS